MQIIGRTSPADSAALAAASVLPVTGRRLRSAPPPWEPAPKDPFLTREEETRILTRELQQLPPRTFYVYDRSRSYPAQLVRIRNVAPRADAMHSTNLMERLQQGTEAISISTLEREIRERKDATFEPLTPFKPLLQHVAKPQKK